MRPFERLYHLTEADNVTSIFKHGLLSTERLVDLLRIADPEREVSLRGHRPDCVRLSEGVMIRDQRPMPPAILARALEDGLEPADWYALLNSLVFLWPDRSRMERHRRAYASRHQTLLTFDGKALLERFRSAAFVSPINSGNARRKAVSRSRDTIIPYNNWLKRGWPTGQRTRPAAEVLFRCPLPVKAPYLIDIIEP